MRIINLIFGLSLLIGSQTVYSQLKVKPDGHVGIGTNNPITRLHVVGEGLIDSYTGPWGRAFWTRIHHKNASAYNLWNSHYMRDVFFVNGEGWLWARQGAYVGTDSSIIENISPIISPLESVMQLNGIRFNYSDGKNRESENKYRLGLVAQEVELVVPDAVKVMPDSLKAVAYMDLVPLLIEAMKEQQEQILSLKAALLEQEQVINKIKNRRWYKRKTVN